MKKLISILFIIFTSIFLFGYENKDSCFTYDALGSYNLFMPTYTRGFREHNTVLGNGVDVNFSISSIIILSRVEGTVKYLAYVNNKYYFAIGGGVYSHFLALPNNLFTFGAFPVFAFGKESSNHFHEVAITIPQAGTQGVSFIPFIGYKYGF